MRATAARRKSPGVQEWSLQTEAVPTDDRPGSVLTINGENRQRGLSRIAAGARLVAITLLAAVALRQLIALGDAPWMAYPSTWATADPLEAIVFVVWALALGTAAWLLFSVLLVVVARATGSQTLKTASRWTAIPAIRRLAERVTAVSLVISTLATPSAALAQQTPPIPVIAVVESTEEPAPSLPAATNAESSTPAAVPPLPALVVRPNLTEAPTPDFRPAVDAPTPVEQATAQTHVVAPGENLWMISHDTLHARLGRAPSDQETTTYWIDLIDANRPNLRSGDPDLIIPGESIDLPETS